MTYKPPFCRQENFPELNIKHKNGGGGLICCYLPFKKKISYNLLVFFYKCFQLELLLCKKTGLEHLMVHLCVFSIVLLQGCVHYVYYRPIPIVQMLGARAWKPNPPEEPRSQSCLKKTRSRSRKMQEPEPLEKNTGSRNRLGKSREAAGAAWT